MFNMSCEKKEFSTIEEANKKLKEIQATEGNNKKPIRSYFCIKCKKYHLTSFTKSKQKKVLKIQRIRKSNRQEKEVEYLLRHKQRKEFPVKFQKKHRIE